jgi:hypothetical protein
LNGDPHPPQMVSGNLVVVVLIGDLVKAGIDGNQSVSTFEENNIIEV